MRAGPLGPREVGMSWIKSASKFLDELDNEAGQAAKEGVVAKTAEGVLERAKLEVVKTLATVEDQGIFEDSDEEGGENQAGGASASAAAVAPLPPPPEAAVRFKPTLSSAAKAAPEPAAPTKPATPATGKAAAAQPEPEVEQVPTVLDGAPRAVAAAPGSQTAAQPAAAGAAPLESALKQQLETQSSELAQLRVSCREREEALESCRAEFDAAVAGYEANLDEFDRERKELVRLPAGEGVCPLCCADSSCRVAGLLRSGSQMTSCEGKS